MNVRRIPSTPPNSPASKTTLSRGDAWPDWDASVVVQSSWANTNAAKSTSWQSSTSRSRVDRPGLNVVVQGSTSATSSSPRVIAWSSLACLPDDPRKMRGLFMGGQVLRERPSLHGERNLFVPGAGGCNRAALLSVERTLGPPDQGHPVADAQKYLHGAGIRGDVLIEGDDRGRAVDDAAAGQGVVRDDQAPLGQPGQHGLVVTDVSVLVGVDEDEVELAPETLDRLERRADVEGDLRA